MRICGFQLIELYLCLIIKTVLIMTLLTLRIDDPSILPTLKRVVKAFKGVSIAATEESDFGGIDEALEDVRDGRVYSATSTDSLFNDILGI